MSDEEGDDDDDKEDDDDEDIEEEDDDDDEELADDAVDQNFRLKLLKVLQQKNALVGFFIFRPVSPFELS